MSWKAGLFLLNVGQSVRINFSWAEGYMGTQFALARPIIEIPGVPLPNAEAEAETTDHGLANKRRGEEREEWIYHVRVRNTNSGFNVLRFELTGGEVQP